EITFNTRVIATSFGQITLTTGGSPVPFYWIWRGYTNLNARVIQLVPSSLLEPNTPYTVSITGVQDLAGNVMAAPSTFSITTGSDVSIGSTAFSNVTVNVGGVQTQLTEGVNVT